MTYQKFFYFAGLVLMPFAIFFVTWQLMGFIVKPAAYDGFGDLSWLNCEAQRFERREDYYSCSIARELYVIRNHAMQIRPNA